jgi:ABC-type uncharacterized transport system substrate-binding protein
VLWNPESRTQPLALKRIEAAARSLGFQLQRVEVRRPEDLEKAFTSMVRERAEALIVLSSTLLRAHRTRIAGLAARHRLPSIFDVREYVEGGGLMSYGPNYGDLFRRAATYVDRILKGARPGDLPIEQPTKFELVISLRTARALALTIPPSLLARADELIQ